MNRILFNVILSLQILSGLGYHNDTSDSAGDPADRLKDLHTCPASCHCIHYETVDCTKAGLTIFPRRLPSQVLYLKIDENRISRVDGDSFETSQLIESLSLRNNNLSDDSIMKGSLSRLSRLRHLNLADNAFRAIPADLPESLVYLSLEGNSIVRIDGHRLYRLSKLQHLYLHDNEITKVRLTKRVLAQLSSVTEITLANNMLTSIPRLPSSVEWLHLTGNRISDIPNGTFRKNKGLIALHLTNNLLRDASISPQAFVGLESLGYLNLSRNKLKSVPTKLPRNLKRLHLEKNRLEYISSEAFQDLKRLRYLLLQENRLNSSSFPSDIFHQLRNLRFLHIYDNNLERLPAVLPRRLEVLMMMSNNIRCLRKKTLRTARRLRELGLQNNEITNGGLEKGALRSLRHLTNIDLSGNKLKALPTLPRSVETVVLSDNRIVRIPRNSVARLKRVRDLLLDGNRIMEIDGIFSNLTSLKRLDLSYNLLRSLPQGLPPNLEYLNLNHNKLFEIRDGSFDSTPNLIDLFPDENKFTQEAVNADAVAVLKHGKNITIAWN